MQAGADGHGLPPEEEREAVAAATSAPDALHADIQAALANDAQLSPAARQALAALLQTHTVCCGLVEGEGGFLADFL